MRPPILQRIAGEPAALGTLVASVLPAFVALGILTMDAETIGVLVVAINGLTGFAIRLLVAPLPRSTAPSPAR
jgi:hypothetical protein